MVTVNSWVINRSISMLIFPARAKACLVNQFFQESDALQPDWRLVLAHQANPKLPKITLEGSIMRLLILSSVLSIRKASAPTPRWRPSWLKLLMVTTMRQSSSFLKHHTEKRLIQARNPGMQLSILEVMLQEKIACFDKILKAVSKFPKPEEKLIQEAQTICKLPPVNPATSVAGERSFSSARHLKTWLLSRMGDLAVLNGHKRRTDCVSITCCVFWNWPLPIQLRHFGQLQKVATSGGLCNIGYIG